MDTCAIVLGDVAARERRRGEPSGPLARENLLLVAASAPRTLDYVDAYGMAILRLLALAWMALVSLDLLERRAREPALRSRVAYLRWQA